MKNTVYYFGLIVCFLIDCSKEDKTDKERELILKNRIKCITEYVTPVRLGVVQKEYMKSVKLFNKKGLLSEETAFLDKTNIDYVSTCIYDKNENLIEKKTLKPDGGFVYKELKRYDNRNNLIELLRFEEPSGPYMYGSTYKYDNKDRMLESTWFWPSGLKALAKYYYIGNKMVEMVDYDAKKKFVFRWKYKYDNRENLIESIQIYPDSSINSKIIYEYNVDNNIIKQTCYTGKIIQYMAAYEYDKNQLLSLKTEYDSAGKISAKFRYEYEFFDDLYEF